MKDALVRNLLRLASSGGQGALSILIYHRVLPAPDPLLPGVVDAAQFEVQVETLKQLFNVVPLREAVQRLAAGTLSPRTASITFDDGYADNQQIALPILRRHGITATFFIASGYLDGGVMWNDKVIEAVRGATQATLLIPALELPELSIATIEDKQRAIVRLLTRLKYLPMTERDRWSDWLLEHCASSAPSNLMMTRGQVRALDAAGMDVGGHTIRHPILTKLEQAEARREIAEGREVLDTLCTRDITLFAYPNGVPGMDFGPQHVRMVKELGFQAAVSTGWGAARTGDDLYQLPRFTPWGISALEFQMRLGINLMRSRLNLPSPPRWELSN
jgi:peptidoglycan/xylan/chitin deacetylase (PgdA/CDA1 family)